MATREPASNWQGATQEGLASPAVDLEGEVDIDDDAFLELDLEEEDVLAPPPVPPSPWHLLARYVMLALI